MANDIYTFSKGVLTREEADVVAEYPLNLHVNGREIATLIASPHDLRFLVAGFLRMQGFVQSVDDFQALSICSDFGAASVTIKGELPERLKPVLTSGCGTGITFNMPKAPPRLVGRGSYTPESIFSLMEEMAKRSLQYRSHGGMHSAAVAKGSLLLHAEDIGRHNTIDRLAGEALLKGINLSGAMLATSGRVSTELIAKASLLGIELVASRTSPTDMALKMAREAGITLVGYVRGGRFNVYAHPQRISAPTVSVTTAEVAA
ncbi:formate dehydrogenase accessory sulfurtransferase FdhD [Geomonas sp. RF6]|uniref:formate dehydrogenase accessory sulfurtransferase FdhD n=1 Tax=Geomonas sp. RF6 TaxID=2897342 RepID=UPI001E4C030A|nr:formate dehydrogenase accessory sulfurtransferase FdhD [Geomonas sp. RF6]UFS70389.1 formate dehydrogenase accessory sulfurtransferase FdhD [Geomonas sp. RF6]